MGIILACREGALCSPVGTWLRSRGEKGWNSGAGEVEQPRYLRPGKQSRRRARVQVKRKKPAAPAAEGGGGPLKVLSAQAEEWLVSTEKQKGFCETNRNK